MLNALVVEDSRYFRQFLCGLLREAVPGIVIAEASDGDQLMVALNAFQPQIVFVDIKLPGANGLQLTQLIKAAHAETLVVIMTSHGQPEYGEAAYKAGADFFFCKDELDMQRILELLRGITFH